jgi:hypothetical protein
MLQYIRDEVAAFSDHEHPKCKAALQAAFCLGEGLTNGRDFPSIARRLKHTADQGAFGEGAGPEAGERNWRRAVRRLAKMIEDDTAQLAVSAGWASTGLPSGYQPVRVRKLVVTYYLTGQTVTELVTERSIEAIADEVDRYIVRDYVQGAPGAYIKVHPLLNCKRVNQLPVDLGPGFIAVKAEMLLPESYGKGSGCTFATRVTRTGVTDATTWQEIQVTSHGINSLTMRVQFDDQIPLPSRCWYFAAAPDLGRLEPPGPGEDRDVAISRFGYAEHHFGAGEPAAKYGVKWRW